MKGSLVREKLRNGECVFGTHIASLMNPIAASMAAEMELDFAFFCTEHMPIDRTEVGMLCQIYAARGISPIVRVPSPDPISISKALDGGAEGIVVPYVETCEQVIECVGAVRYRPLKGEMLEEALSGARELSSKTHQFLNRFNRDKYLIIGVESLPAIENLEALITTADVDGVFLGPHDITVSMGIPEEYDNPLFLKTIESVIGRCRKLGVGVGLHTQLLKIDGQVLRSFINAGMNFMINGADIVVMRDAMNAQIRALREITGSERFHSEANGGEAMEAIESCIA